MNKSIDKIIEAGTASHPVPSTNTDTNTNPYTVRDAGAEIRSLVNELAVIVNPEYVKLNGKKFIV